MNKADGRKLGMYSIAIGGVALLSYLGYLLVKKLSTPAAGTKTGGTTTTTYQGGGNPSSNSIFQSQSAPVTASVFPLKIGSTGSNVTTLQQALIRAGHNQSAADGVFGAEMQAALVAMTGSATVNSPAELTNIVNQSWASNVPASLQPNACVTMINSACTPTLPVCCILGFKFFDAHNFQYN